MGLARTPPLFPIISRNGISSSLPVLSSDWRGVARGANYLLGRGQVLIPWNYPYIGNLVSAKAYICATMFFPKKQALVRTTLMQFQCLPLSSGTIQYSVNNGVGVTQTLTAGAPKQVQVLELTQSYNLDTSLPVSGNLTFTFNGSGSCLFHGYTMFENPRTVLSPATDFAIDETTIDFGLPLMSGSTGQSVYGLAFGVSASLYGMRQAGSFLWTVPYSEANTLITKWAQTISGAANQVLFNGTAIPVRLRHLFGDPAVSPSDNALTCGIWAWSDVLNQTCSVKFVDATGLSGTITVKPTALSAPQWFTCSFSPYTESTTATYPYALTRSDMNFLTITGSRTGGTGNMNITGIFFGEPGHKMF